MAWPIVIGIGAGAAAGAYGIWRRWERQRQEAQEEQFDNAVQAVFGQVRRNLGMSSAIPLIMSTRTDTAMTDYRAVYLNRAWMLHTLLPYEEDPDCIRAILVGVLAHELGHIHNPSGGYSPTNWVRNHTVELQADRVAGSAIARAGVAPACFATVLTHISKRWSITHPPAHQRREALCAGYRAVRGHSYCPT